SQLKQLKEDFTNNLRDLRETCSVFKCVVIIKILRSLRKTQFQELIKCHTKKLSRLISKDIDTDEHRNNISSCHLSFFEKSILCRGLKFSLPQHCYSKDIQASFEKAIWRLDPLIKDPKKKDVASATLPSIALHYIAKKGQKEKQLHEKVHKILPKATAEQLCPKGSRLAHLYGLPKTRTQRKTVHETHLISLWHVQLPSGEMAG
ncbi:unnamed protein product, partial [Porites evermanni]